MNVGFEKRLFCAKSYEYGFIGMIAHLCDKWASAEFQSQLCDSGWAWFNLKIAILLDLFNAISSRSTTIVCGKGV